jgi:hypothetical protein
MIGSGICFQMRIGIVPRIVFLVLLQNAVATQPRGVTSPQGLFHLQCDDQVTARREERRFCAVEKRFYELTGFEPQGYPPVVVLIHGHESSEGLPSLRVDSLEGGMPRIQIDLPEKEVPRFGIQAAGVLSDAMLLRERYAGKAPVIGSPIPAVPAWLSHGLATLCIDESTQKTIQVSYLQGGAPPGIEAFLVERPPNDENHLLEENYDLRAATLLQAGLKGDGSAVFRKWIRGDASNDSKKNHDSTASLSRWPAGWPMQRVEREWLLLMATSSHEEKGVTGELNASESLRQYDAVAQSIPMDADSFGKFRKERGADFTFQGINSRLSALRFQANPLVIPLIDSTMNLLKSGMHLSGKKLNESLSTLTSLRASILKRTHEINEYLDWYEAAKIPVRSGLFDAMLKSSEPRLRKGPVGRYLDAVETRGW